MARAWIDGKAATLADAIERAAAMLGASRCALIAGLGTDVAGARAAIGLARRIGAVVDHMHSPELFRNLAVMRGAGVLLTTPGEARPRADTLLLVGPVPEETWLAQAEWLRGGAPRSLWWLCPGRNIGPAQTKLVSGRESVETVGREPSELPVLLAALRARIAGRPIGKLAVPAKRMDELVAQLKAARFGVAIWSASLDALAIEMLCGIVDDLNRETRFAGLPLAPGDNALGVLHVCGWMTGFPMRTGFGRGRAEHDPWRFEADRLIASGETDCVLWISAYRPQGPAWDRMKSLIALTGPDAAFASPPNVQIEVGRPGVDHDGVAYLPATAGLATFASERPSAAISVADAIGHIVAALPGAKASPC
jgi:formylmethanofuran dehydrogenase subunit B